MERLVAREMAAVEALYDRDGDLVYSFLMRMLGDARVAGELLQVTFTQLWERAPHIQRADRDVDDWALAVAHELGIAEARRRREVRTQVDDEQSLEAGQTSSLPTLRAGNAPDRWLGKRGRMREALHSLPQDQRRTLEMCYFHGYTQEEIARLVGAPLATIQGRLRLSLQQLSSALDLSDAPGGILEAAHLDDQVAAYAFGALGGRERRQVEAHLVTCAACASAVREAERVAALLPYTVTPYSAPPDLRAALLERLQARGVPRALAGDGRVAPVSGVARPTWWKRLVLQGLPWAAAIAGWLLALVLLSYSHGQADRITTMQQDERTRIRTLSDAVQRAQTIQSYLYTPGVTAAQLTYEAGKAAHTVVMLYYAPGYAHALLTARGLAVLPSYKIYRIWALTPSGTAAPLGRLITAGPRAEGSSVIAAPQVLDHYAAIGVSLEPQVVSLPAKPILIFKVLLAAHR